MMAFLGIICAGVAAFVFASLAAGRLQQVFARLAWRVKRIVANYKLKRRTRKFESQFVDGLTLVSNAIRSGLSLQQAFEMASLEMQGPFGEELAQVLADVRLGASVEDALHNMEVRLECEDLNIVVQAICILRETGGNIIETFQIITSTIRERQKVHGKIRVLTTQGLAQGVIIFCMPFALAILLYLIAPDLIRPLFTTPLGLLLVMIGLTLQFIGAFIMKKIVMIRV